MGVESIQTEVQAAKKSYEDGNGRTQNARDHGASLKEAIDAAVKKIEALNDLGGIQDYLRDLITANDAALQDYRDGLQHVQAARGAATDSDSTLDTILSAAQDHVDSYDAVGGYSSPLLESLDQGITEAAQHLAKVLSALKLASLDAFSMHGFTGVSGRMGHDIVRDLSTYDQGLQA